MDYGIDNGRFYIEHTSCERMPGTLRQESELRAQELYKENNKIILCTSSGLDSQTALHSFKSQGIPVECAFMHLIGYNDSEYENIKLLEKKYGYKTVIIEINPDDVKDECIELANRYDSNPHHILHYKFVEQLPSDYNIIQVIHDPWIVTKKQTGKHYIFHSFYDPEIARYNPLASIRNIRMFGDSSEFFASSISDSMFSNFLDSWQYYEGNNLVRQGKPIHDVFRYEYYIKPMLYAKHWRDDLMYFPKFAGYENISWMQDLQDKVKRERMCFIEYKYLVNFLLHENSGTHRFYEQQWNDVE